MDVVHQEDATQQQQDLDMQNHETEQQEDFTQRQQDVDMQNYQTDNVECDIRNINTEETEQERINVLNQQTESDGIYEIDMNACSGPRTAAQSLQPYKKRNTPMCTLLLKTLSLIKRTQNKAKWSLLRRG